VSAGQDQARTRFGLLPRQHWLARGLSLDELSELQGIANRFEIGPRDQDCRAEYATTARLRVRWFATLTWLAQRTLQK
jgi:hypothetical protein